MSTASVEDLPYVTFADHLAVDEASEVRNEWVGGWVCRWREGRSGTA